MGETLTVGVPKGSLQESTLSLFSRAGYNFGTSGRSLWLSSNDPEIKPVLLRPQESPLSVADGSLDCGLSGLDWINETNTLEKLRLLADLCYAKQSFRPVRWVLAVQNDAPWQTIEDIRRDPKRIRISTELKATTENWLAERGVIADVSFSWGATEAKVPVFADAIVDVTETGSSLRANGLRIVDTLCSSTTQFFANKEFYKNDEWKRNKVDAIALLLRSCLAADKRVSIHVEAPSDAIPAIKAVIPSDARYSVVQGHDGSSLVDIIADRDEARDIVPKLAACGAGRISVMRLGLLYE